MASSQASPPPPPLPIYYTRLPPQPDAPNYILLPLHRPGTASPRRLRTICAGSLVLLATVAYILYPSEPDLDVVRLRLNRVHFRTVPQLLVDISLLLTVKVHNADVYYMDYSTLDVAIGYRGKMLGHVKSDHGHVRALGSSYVDAELEFDGVEVFSNVMLLLEDLAKGTVPLDTVTTVEGRVGLFFFGFPLKAKVSCGISVNTNNQTIGHQNCYPE
ncbi:LEA_2 domain-containing protein [Psidium guajava]|nr:LEA_2 domain-containing protein [Psidium guajava]